MLLPLECADMGPSAEILHLVLQLWEFKRALLGWLIGWNTDHEVVHSEEAENADLPWLLAEQRIQRLREFGMLEQVCHLRLTTHAGRIQETHLLPQLWEINLWGEDQYP